MDRIRPGLGQTGLPNQPYLHPDRPKLNELGSKDDDEDDDEDSDDNEQRPNENGEDCEDNNNDDTDNEEDDDDASDGCQEEGERRLRLRRL